MRKNKIIHIDDSLIVRKTVKNQLVSLENMELISCDSFSQLLELLDQNKDLEIDLIITDLNMPNVSGYQILEWIKTSPLYHYIPVLILTAESSADKQSSAIKKGAAQVIVKPYNVQDLINSVERHCHPINRLQIRELDESFIQNCLMTVEEMLELFENKKDGVNTETLLQKLHQIKGDSLSSQWPIIAQFVHDVEDVWKFCVKNKSVNNKQLFDVTIDGIVAIHRMLLDLKLKKPHRIPQIEFYNEFIQIRKNVEKGWVSTFLNKSDTQSKKQESKVEEDSNKESSEKIKSLLENRDFIRIQREKLDEIYLQVKRISQIKNRMSIFINNLKKEMSDEPFLIELSQMNQDLALESQTLTEYFLLMRSKELRYLIDNFRATVKKTSSSLNKNVNLLVNADENLPIDSVVLSKMESILGHLIRNSLDHGMEDENTRILAGKTATGSISLEVSIKNQIKQTDDMVQFIFKDNGCGINVDKMRAKVKSMGLMSEEQIKFLSDKNVMMMIFLDSVSTKDGVSIISGRGVGMSSIKKEVEALQGEITLDSGPWGTSFEITIPRYYKL